MVELSKLHFYKTGSGPNSILFFHGFGQDHLAFSIYFSALEKTHTCYSIDLFYHGKSDWPDKKVTKAVLSKTLSAFLDQEGISTFTVVGFSLGGRFCISAFTSFADRIDRVILIAPDGIHQSPWYRIAVSRLFNPLFKFLMAHPSAFDTFVRFFEMTGFVSGTLVKFSKKELSTPENRTRVYFSWTHLKPIQVKPELFATLLHTHKKTCDLILGSKDSIIRPEKLLPLIPRTSSIQLHTLHAKHHHMIAAAFPLIISLLKEAKQ